jgi:hypothetical protein
MPSSNRGDGSEGGGGSSGNEGEKKVTYDSDRNMNNKTYGNL